MSARLISTRVHLTAAIVLAAVATWLIHHGLNVSGVLEGKDVHSYAIPTALLFATLSFQLTTAYFNKPFTTTRRQQNLLNEMKVAGIVPAYNEDPNALMACIRSMVLLQTRKPDILVVVDDGSKSDIAMEYNIVRGRAALLAHRNGVEFHWITQKNAGKRHAQAAAINILPSDVNVIWTVDSDTISDKNALRELLKPFKDPQIQSVAGIVMAANVKKSFFVRFTDLWFVASQLADRSSQSVFGSVWVNSGPIAAYRIGPIRENLSGYLSETFMGRKVPFSDDSLMTLYAMMNGKTVQQPSAFCFSLMPEKINHFQRMYIRWMRGSSIRSLWRFRYLPISRPAYWLHLQRWITTALATVLFILALGTVFTNTTPLGSVWFMTVPLVVGYAVSLRFLIIRRSDQSLAYQMGTWMLSPLAVVFAIVYLRALRWYGLVTCYKTGWGTRKTVEVSL